MMFVKATHDLPLVTFSGSIKKSLKNYQITDRTAELWEEHQQKKIDLNSPFCLFRDREITQIQINLLGVKNPSNILITGGTGSGKSVLIKELARRILMNKTRLQGKHILEMPEIVSREMMQFLAKEVGTNAILIFDECHRNLTSPIPQFTGVVELIQDFSTQNFGPLADKCKTLLAEKKLLVIGLTDRLGDFLEKDLARARRFTKIELQELSIDGTIELIRETKYEKQWSVEQKYDVKLSDETLRTGIYLSLIYCPELFLPSKLYMILDPAIVWFFSSKKSKTLTSKDLIDYAVEILGKKREDVEEKLEEMDELARSPIPPHEPLAKYSTNLSSQARRKKLARAWGRGKLISNIAAIFGQEEFNNVLLTSPPGTGKTRIAEGLAHAIFKGKFLEGKEVLLLNWQLAKNDIPGLLKSARKYQGKFILVIDEAHRLAGSFANLEGALPGQLGDLARSLGGNLGDMGSLLSGSLSSVTQMAGSGNALNELKEAMGRGELPSLLLSTNQEAAPLLKDPAIMRRLERKKLMPLTKNQLLIILKHEMPILNSRYQQNCTLTEEAREAIYYLAKIFHKDEYQPSSSFKVLHCIYSYAREHKIEEITQQTVFQAVSKRKETSVKEIEEQCRRECIADHPSSQKIPDDEPLKRFSDEWTKEARMGNVPDYVGHEAAFVEMQNVLCRETSNNVLLIGKAGTGKTTLVRRLAYLMTTENARSTLRNKPLFALRFGELRENRQAFSDFLACAKEYAGEYVLFIDEIHLLFSNSNTGLLPTFSRELEELKPLLSEGKITLIGATTEQDLQGITLTEAVKRRFTAIPLAPPSKPEAIVMIQRVKENMEKKLEKRLSKQVRFTEGAIQRAVDRGGPDQLPASAISLLELAAVTKQQNEREDEPLEVTGEDIPEEKPSYFEQLEEIAQPRFGIREIWRLFTAFRSPSSRSAQSQNSLVSRFIALISWPFVKIGELVQRFWRYCRASSR